MQLESTLRLTAICSWLAVLFSLGIPEPAPIPPGSLIEIGGRRLHLNCTGMAHRPWWQKAVLAHFPPIGRLCSRESRNLRRSAATTARDMRGATTARHSIWSRKLPMICGFCYGERVSCRRMF